MSENCGCPSHLEFNESEAGSGISDLSVIGQLECSSGHLRCSLSDLGDYDDVKRSLMNEKHERHSNLVIKNGTARNFSGPRDDNEDANVKSGSKWRAEKECSNNVLPLSVIKKEISPFSKKIMKKRASLGLGFNIQIFKEAKQLFNKRKADSDSNSSELYSFAILRNESKKEGLKYETSLKSFQEFFPHVISTETPSSNLNNSLPPCKTNLSAESPPPSTFQSVSSTYPPPAISITNISKNVDDQFGKFDRASTREENEGEEEKENGNYLGGRWETELNFRKESNVDKRYYENYKCNYLSGNNCDNCLSHLKYEKRNCLRNKLHLDTTSEDVRARLNCGCDISSSDLEVCGSKESFQKLSNFPIMAVKSSTFKVRRSGSSRMKNNFPHGSRLHSSSTDIYDVTTDEEGDVDTSMTSSNEGLTSNLSLFTSAEGEDEGVSVWKDNLFSTKGRENLNKCVNVWGSDLENSESTKQRRKETKEIRKPFIKWREKSPRNENELKKSSIATIQTTSTTTTITTTTAKTTTALKTLTSVSKKTTSLLSTSNGVRTSNSQNYSFRNFFNNKMRICKNDTSRREGKQTEESNPEGSRGKSNRHHHNEKRENVGLRSLMTKKGHDPVKERSSPHCYLPRFSPERMREVEPLHTSGFVTRDSNSRLKTEGKFEVENSATVTSMQEEIADLSTQLEAVTREKELFESSLNNAQLAHARAERETNAKLDNVTQQYEERITELHSVIAELTRKLDRQREDIILEEDEEEEELGDGKGSKERPRCPKTRKYDEEDGVSISEFSSQEQNEITECSASETAESEAMFEREESNGEANQHPATDVSTSCEIDDRAVEAGQCIADLDVNCCGGESNSNVSNFQQSNENITDDAAGDDVMCQASSSAGLEDELKLLREENSNMQQALTLAQHKATSQRSVIMALSREREALKKKLKELEKMQPGIPHSSPHISDAIMVRGLRGSPLSGSLFGPLTSAPDSSGNSPSRALSPSVASQHHNEEESTSQEGVKVICKLAERVRLKKAESGDARVTGSDLSAGVSTTAVAEQLAAGVQEESDAQELFHALATAGGVFAPHERLKEYELEAERLHARIDHLKAQNDVLSATLCESKACCDRLALKTGRAEAQSGALKLGVEVLDRIQEAFEVLTALHEAQIALLIVTCQVTGVDLGAEMGFEPADQDVDPLVRVKRAQEQRRTAENVARHLLSRLDHVGTKPVNCNSEPNGIHSMSSSTTSYSSETAHQEEFMLRDAISRLQEERARILASFKVGSDSSPLEDYFPQKTPLSEDEAHKLDLENAVLMQELTAIREDRAELRAQVYLLEREKTGLELRIGTCEAQSAALYATIDHLKAQLVQLKASKNSELGGGDSGVETASSEAESLRRETQLKTRIDDLVATLEKVTKNSEARHRQSQEFINDLKKANSALLTAVDRLKKKYTLRVKRMEQQTLNLVNKHEQQVKHMKNRIGMLEGKLDERNLSSRQSTSPSEAN